MSEIPTMRLKNIAEINPRLTSRPAPNETISFVGMADVDAVNGTTSPGVDRPFGEVAKGYTPFRDQDILVAKITPCFQNGKIAQARLRNTIGVGSTEFHVIRPHDAIASARYILAYLRQTRVIDAGERRMTGSGGQRRVPDAFISELEIPIPSIDEQRRIADALDRADALRAKRREAIARLDELAQSIFLDMFGDPDECWPKLKVAELAASHKGAIRTGPFGSQLLHEEFTAQGIPVLGIDNAVENEFRWSKRRYISEEKYRDLTKYTVQPGDVLITIMGTCGRCAIVPRDIPTAINTKHLCCITLDQDRCLPEFLHSYFLRHPAAKSYLRRSVKGAIMSGLNMAIIKSLPVSTPPITLQQRYVDRLRAIESLKQDYVWELSHLDALFTSLQLRAFRGDL